MTFFKISMTLGLAFALNIFKPSLDLGTYFWPNSVQQLVSLIYVFIKLHQEKNYNKKITHTYKKSKIKAKLGLEKERLDGKAKSSRWRG